MQVHMLKEYDLYFLIFFPDETTIDTMYYVTVYVLAFVVWVGLLHKFKPPYWMKMQGK